jgi:hypothetical protein
VRESLAVLQFGQWCFDKLEIAWREKAFGARVKLQLPVVHFIPLKWNLFAA